MKVADFVSYQGDQPIFTMPNGTVLRLQRVSGIVLMQWGRRYLKDNPPPEPPMGAIKIAGKEMPRPDTDNPYYKEQAADHQTVMNIHHGAFILSRGVVDTPPDDYALDAELVVDGTPQERKFIWIYELAEGQDEVIAVLIEAVNSLGHATPDALEDAEKN